MRCWLLLLASACAAEPSDTGGVLVGVTGITYGDCEDAAASEPSFSVEVDRDGRLIVHLDDLEASCCPSPVGEFTRAGEGVTLDFVDVIDTSTCDCRCVSDFTVTSAPFESGSYTLEIRRDGATLATLPVEVP